MLNLLVPLKVCIVALAGSIVQDQYPRRLFYLAVITRKTIEQNDESTCSIRFVEERNLTNEAFHMRKIPFP
jgi:hypothetical protein